MFRPKQLKILTEKLEIVFDLPQNSILSKCKKEEVVIIRWLLIELFFENRIKQATIAKRFKMSQQAVSRALSSLKDYYRSDREKVQCLKRTIERLKNERNT